MDRESFLSVIADQPDGDASRLVYADWLEENGDAAQAEFIRVQMQLAALDEHDLLRPALAQRERELLIEHGMNWARVLVDHAALDWNFRKGTLHWARYTLADFLRHGETALERTPVRHITLIGARGGLADLAASPLLGRLHSLDLGRYLDNEELLQDADLVALSRSPHLGRLESLILSGNAFTSAGLAALLDAPSLRELKELNLTSVPLDREAAAVLASSEALAGLRALNVGSTDMGPDALRALGAARSMPELRELGVSNFRGRERSLAVLFAGGAFLRLRKLDMHGQGLTDGLIATFAVSSFGENLEYLKCGRASASTLNALLRLPRLCAVKRLQLGASRRPPGGVGLQPSLADFPGGEARILIDGMPTEAAECLAGADLPKLRWLGLHAWNAREVARHLTRWPGLGRLSALDLSGTPLGVEGLRLLAECPQLAGLKRLEVAWKNGEGGIVLALSPHLRGLESLSVGPTLDPASHRALASSPFATACREALAASEARLRWPEEWWPYLYDHNGQSFSGCRGGLPRLTDEHVARLAEVPALTQVRELNVGQSEMTIAGLRSLLASPFLTGLRLLRLSFNQVGDEGAEMVAACPKLAGLLSLKMSFCSVGNAGVKALASSPYLADLRVLKLWGGGIQLIGDEGAKAIAASPTFRRLVALRLRNNAIGDEGAVALAESPHLNDLMHLYISGNRYHSRGETALRRRFGARVGYFALDPYTVGLW